MYLNLKPRNWNPRFGTNTLSIAFVQKDLIFFKLNVSVGKGNELSDDIHFSWFEASSEVKLLALTSVPMNDLAKVFAPPIELFHKK